MSQVQECFSPAFGECCEGGAVAVTVNRAKPAAAELKAAFRGYLNETTVQGSAPSASIIGTGLHIIGKCGMKNKQLQKFSG